MPIQQTERTHVTKGYLGVCYIAGTGVVLGLVLLGHLLRVGTTGLLWAGVGLLPVAGLVGTAHWGNRLGLTNDQIWTVAIYSAVALGGGAAFMLVFDFVTRLLTFSRADTLLLVTSLGTLTALGALAGIIRELHRTNRRLELRNTVLHRVLRHNLRNDMTVLLCLLDELEETADERERETLDRARQKVHGLVDLTDKVRQVNVAASMDGSPVTTLDLGGVLRERVDDLRMQYPEIDIETDLPDSAFVRATGRFGLVLDNVVQSAVAREKRPELHVSVSTRTRKVTLRIEDKNDSIPEADLSALVTRGETDFDHGFGMELWLVYWLVEASGGDISVETAGDVRRIEVELDRVTDGPTSSEFP